METERIIELVVMARQGDENAMQDLYLDAYRGVYYTALRMVKNPDDAEDITQEVFITVNEKISQLREPVTFYKWVNQIAVNQCNAFLRKYKGIAKLDDDADILALVDDNPLNLPDKAIDDAETRRIILEVIDDLPIGQRVCVMYYYYQQFTISQIADMLEINENTVKSRLALARAKIRAALEEKEKKEGIKLYGIPLALTPILRQAAQDFVMPEGVAERMWENISKAISGGAPPNNGPGADQPEGSGTSGQFVQKSGTGGGSGISGAAGQAAAGAGMTLAAKIIIGIVAAAVVTAGAIIVPRLMETPPEETPPAITDEATPAPVDTEEQGTDTVPPDDTSAAYEYYARELRAFLDSGYSGYSVMLKDIDRDGAEELVTYWEDTAPDQDGSLERIYRMDIFDWDGGEELHFTQEKSDAYGHEWEEAIYLSDTVNLVFYSHYADVSPQPGWVYDHSKMYSIKGGMNYASEWIEAPAFDGEVITESRFIELCEEYGLELLVQEGNSSPIKIVEAKPKASAFPNADTQNDILRLLPDYVLP